jgi:hypothetical protein
MASAAMTPQQIAHYENMPVWMTAVWAVGVWGAFPGVDPSPAAEKAGVRGLRPVCRWRRF